MRKIRLVSCMLFLLLILSFSSQAALYTKKQMPDFLGVTDWINTASLKREDLLGKVVLIHFWSVSSVESLRDMQIVQTWYDKYQVEGIEVVGIHVPEKRIAFHCFEHEVTVAAK